MKKENQFDFSLSPFIVIWEVTQACDLACIHCRAKARPWRDPGELTTEEGYSLIDEIKKFGGVWGSDQEGGLRNRSPLLVFTGGDPVKREDLYDLIRYGVSRGLRTTVSPSVTPLLTKEAIRKFKESGISRMAISLDGAEPDIHDSFRGVNGSYEWTLRAIRDCVEEKIPIQINTTVTRYNFENLEEIAYLIRNFENVVLWSVFFLVPTGRGKKDDQISPEEYEAAFHDMYELSKTMPYDIKSTEAPHYRRLFIQRALEESRRGEQPVVRDRVKVRWSDTIGRASRGINDGNGFVFISHTGEVYPSGFLPISAGNVKQKSLVDIYRNSPLFRELRDYSKLKGKCGVCEFRKICGGSRARAFAMTGDYMESEPNCVYIPKNSKTDYS
ncbi:MAG TPA: TIGR04053 family radical SAM/SPASM domain-containing protein [Thermodesulfobacteriota bacterium]|nr:TIGR04053 family radical SAM/SPASM domain-containing protein [Thermodesulfobacteriota bacterium]